MKRRCALLALALIPGLLVHCGGKITPAAPAIKLTYYVAKNGNDVDPGSLEKPFASIEKAQEISQKRLSSGSAYDISILIRSGVYELEQPLVFNPNNAANRESITTYAAYPGEQVVLSGGRQVTGFKKGNGDLWTAFIPAVKGGDLNFRQLFIDGQRATRARTPNRTAPAPYGMLSDALLSDDFKSYTYKFDVNPISGYKNIAEIEVVTLGIWETTRKKIERVDPAAGLATMAGPHAIAHPAVVPAGGTWFYLENALEMLDQPGEWYLDRSSGVLSYWPLPGQDLQQASIMVPRLTHLVELRGTPEAPIQNLHFRGIQFAYTDFSLPSVGYLGIQACHYINNTRSWETAVGGKLIDAAIIMENAINCSIEDTTICHIGGSAIELKNNCMNCIVQGNYIYDISANGIQIGGMNTEELLPRWCKIDNNHIHTCGIDYYGAVGIWAGFVQNLTITHNEIHDLPYSGISLGWSWDSSATQCQNNSIELNHIHNTMNQLTDGGGIYTLGFQPNSVIQNNHIHDIHRSTYAQDTLNNGLFIDEGSRGFFIDNNLIYATASSPLRSNCPLEWQSWGENYFSKDSMIVSDSTNKIIKNAGLELRYQYLLQK